LIDKFARKSQEIQEIISQKEVFLLSHKIKENNENDEKKKITYDKNNLKGC